MVVYPEGTWYHRVQSSDLPDILDAHLRTNKPLARLQWSDTSAMHAMAVDHNNKYRAMLAARDRAGVLPDSLDQIIRSYWPSRCLLTELDIFTAVGDGATAYQVGAKVSASGRGIEMLLNALVSLKLLTKSEGKYFNTPEAGFAQVTRINLPGLSDLVVGRGR